MDEREFLSLAEAELARLEAALDTLAESDDGAWDHETRPGGIIEIEFANGGKIVINRHVAAREIWVAARSGGYHFKPPAKPGEPWRDTRAAQELPVVLARCMSEQAGTPLALAW